MLLLVQESNLRPLSPNSSVLATLPHLCHKTEPLMNNHLCEESPHLLDHVSETCDEESSHLLDNVSKTFGEESPHLLDHVSESFGEESPHLLDLSLIHISEPTRLA